MYKAYLAYIRSQSALGVVLSKEDYFLRLRVSEPLYYLWLTNYYRFLDNVAACLYGSRIVKAKV